MGRFRVVIVLSIFFMLSCPGCREPPDPPSKEAVDMAWQRADQAVVSAERARNEARQAGRLRDIDRLRNESERDKLAGQVSVLGGFTLAFLKVLRWAIPNLTAAIIRLIRGVSHAKPIKWDTFISGNSVLLVGVGE